MGSPRRSGPSGTERSSVTTIVSVVRDAQLSRMPMGSWLCNSTAPITVMSYVPSCVGSCTAVLVWTFACKPSSRCTSQNAFFTRSRPERALRPDLVRVDAVHRHDVRRAAGRQLDGHDARSPTLELARDVAARRSDLQHAFAVEVHVAEIGVDPGS